MFDPFVQAVTLEELSYSTDPLIIDNLEIIIDLLTEILAINHLIIAFGVSIVILLVIYSTLKKFFY